MKSETGKFVLVGLSRARAKVGEGSVGVESVELFLRLHSSESGDDIVALVGTDDLEARNLVYDVEKQFYEVGDLE
jgi:hypothetical protein